MKYFFIILIAAHVVFAVELRDIELFPEKVLGFSGHSADVCVNPLDGSVHFIWVANGDLKYAVRTHAGVWSEEETCPDAGEEIYGTDEGGWERHCAAITIDAGGKSHLVFTTRSGRIYYLSGSPGDWGTPLSIAEQAPAIMPDIVKSGSRLFVVWEDGEADDIYTLSYQNGSWGNPVYMVRGEYPSLAVGTDGTVYFLTRSRTLIRNAVFAYMPPGSTSWNYVNGATDAPDRLGSGPKLTVANGKLYMGWSNSVGIDGPNKSQLYCAVAGEPGLAWNTRLDNEIVFSESTGDPHPRVNVFPDGSLLFLNGNRRGRLRIHDGTAWSGGRIVAPWDGVIPECAPNGNTIWVVLSSVMGSNGKVSAYGIRAPGSDAVDDLSIEHTVLAPTGFGGGAVMDRRDGTIHCAWYQNDGLWYSKRPAGGTRQSNERIAVQNIDTYNSPAEPELSLDIDRQGDLFIIYLNNGGGLSGLTGRSGEWSTPFNIPETQNAVSPAVAVRKTGTVVAWTDTITGMIKTIEYKNTRQSITTVGEGSAPRLGKGQNGLVFLIYRRDNGARNFLMTSKIPFITPWSPPLVLTDAEHLSGHTAGLTVDEGRIYLAWSNNTGQRGDWQSQLFCATSDEAGADIQSRTGSRFDRTGIVFMHAAEAPMPAAGVYSNGDLLLVNGREAPRFALGSGTDWTKTRAAPWENGLPSTMNDGQSVWVYVSPRGGSPGPVSVTAIEHPTAAGKDFSNNWPKITSTPDTTAVTGSVWTYNCVARDDDNDPLDFSLLYAPQGLTIDPSTGDLLWVPDENALTDPWQRGTGVHLVGIRADDNRNGHDVQFFWLYVSEQTNAPPSFVSTPVTHCFAETLYTYQSHAVDPDDDQLFYELQNAPPGMTIDAGTGLVTWLPVGDQVGRHTVVLRVQDPPGAFDQQQYVLTVRKPAVPPPVAEFSATPTQGIAPLVVTFRNQSSGGIDACRWQFGDGHESSEMHPEHTFYSPGQYTVSLQVTGPGGTGTKTRDNYIHVFSAPPVAGFDAQPTSGPMPLSVQFNDSSSGAITSRLWSFGDAATATEKSPRHIYTQPGQFDVSLTVAGPGGEDTKMRQKYITVFEPAPAAGFSASPRQGLPPLTVQFTDTSRGTISSWNWTFGDGAHAGSQNPVHIYETTGLFDVSLDISGPGGTDKSVRHGYIHVFDDPSPHAAFSATPTTGEWPLKVQFADSSTGDITTWFWDFGDSTASMKQNPVHVYRQSGRFDVRLTVNGPGGSHSHEKKQYIVITDPPLSAGFSASPLNGIMPLTVRFTDTSTGPVDTRLWRFGDGGTSKAQNPVHIYGDHGLFSVTLLVKNNTAIDSLVKKDYINVAPELPVAYFSAAPLNGKVPLTVQFQDSSSGLVESWQWDFGDSTKSSDQNPIHTYILPGFYSVRLTVRGPGGQNSFTRPSYIRVDLPSGVQGHPGQPEMFALKQNYPNPFNAVTTIPYQLAGHTALSLVIFDMRGNRIKTLLTGQQRAGEHKIKWDGTNQDGTVVASGIYVVQLDCGAQKLTQKVLFIR